MAAINDAQTRQELGRLGEELAVDYFRQRGMLVLDRNWRPQRANLRGELDLVVRDEDTLVIVEVKTRRCLAFGSPAESVTRRKLRALHSLALAWLDQRPGAHASRRPAVRPSPGSVRAALKWSGCQRQRSRPGGSRRAVDLHGVSRGGVARAPAPGHLSVCVGGRRAGHSAVA